jgi:hypothetical protein
MCLPSLFKLSFHNTIVCLCLDIAESEFVLTDNHYSLDHYISSLANVIIGSQKTFNSTLNNVGFFILDIFPGSLFFKFYV